MLCKTEVYKRDVAIFTHQDVLRFEVTVHDLFRVKIAQSHGDLHRIEASSILGEPLCYMQMPGELATPHELHDKVDPQIILEHVIEPNEEWVVYSFL